MLDNRKHSLGFSGTVLGILGCAGAAGGGGSTAENPDDAPPSPGEEGMALTDVAEPTAPPDPCASGTCTKCGDAVCLIGFYCEEAISACGWLPECADAPSCDCVGRFLADCRCEDRAGGVYVDCQ